MADLKIAAPGQVTSSGEGAALRLALAVIEEMAEERHLLHGASGDRFWGCSRPACRKASAFLRGSGRPSCKARAAGTAGGNDPQDCDWPWCGCDPVAGRVLAAIQEQGLEIVRRSGGAPC